MKIIFDPKIYHRKSIRLKEYDYSQAGGYYITIVSSRREFIFGEVENGEMHIDSLGNIIQECWYEIPVHFPNLEDDLFVIMPNHLHGILIIHDDPGRGTIYRAPTPAIENRDPTATMENRVPTPTTEYRAPTPTIEQFGKPVVGSIPTIIRTFKAVVTRRARRELNLSNIWQSNY